VADAVLDLDMPARWPSELRQAACDGANRLRGTTSYTLDLAVPTDLATTIQKILDRYRLRAFHCTRLLEWEVTDIRQNGLRAASTRDRGHPPAHPLLRGSTHELIRSR